MKSVQFDVQSDEKASRVELFVRIVWYIVSTIVLFVYTIIAEICFVLQWLIILITGKRNTSLNNVLKGYLRYSTRLIAYTFLMTDERSPIIPQD